MTVRIVSELNKHPFSISYAGESRGDDHSIDVEALAPALLAFGRLVREANIEFNAKKATSKVLVVSDFEHKCFNINFEIVLSIYEQVKTLFESDAVKTAKEIIEWLGLATPAGLGGVGISYLSYMKLKNGRKVEETQLIDQSGSGNIAVKIEGEKNPVTINQHIYNMSVNPKVLKSTRDAMSPVGSNGFDRIQLRDNSGVIGEITGDETQSIMASCNRALLDTDDETQDIEETNAWLSVYSPVFDTKASSWRFRYGKETVYADISGTDIAQQAMRKGGSFTDDSYHVKLEITTQVDAAGKRGKPAYKILSVINFVPGTPMVQSTLAIEPSRKP